MAGLFPCYHRYHATSETLSGCQYHGCAMPIATASNIQSRAFCADGRFFQGMSLDTAAL
jgi:hypothetical protein